MPSSVIRVRDIVRGDLHDFGPTEPALRGSYDLFHPDGPVRLREGDVVEWFEHDVVRTSRVALTSLGEVQPGERVLVRDDAEIDLWWLCDVEDG